MNRTDLGNPNKRYGEGGLTQADIDAPGDIVMLHGKQAFDIVRMSDIEAKSVRWLWRDHLPRGYVTLIVGEPGLGKGQVITSIVSAITTGGKFYDGTDAKVGNVIMLSSEDAADDTIKPRLLAAGADTDRVFLLRSQVGTGKKRWFSLKADLDILKEVVKEVGGAELITIDALSSYMGGADYNSQTEARSIMDPLNEMAAEIGVGIVGIVHPPKTKHENIINLVAGSKGFAASARMVFAVQADDDTPGRRVLNPIKANLCLIPPGRGYHIEAATVSNDPASLPIFTSRVVWDDAPVKSAKELNGSSGNYSALKDAEIFLQELLADGPLPSKQVFADADENGISKATLKRAKTDIGVISKKTGTDGCWAWSLEGDQS